MTALDPYAEIARVLMPSTEEEPIRSYAALGDSFTAGTGCNPGESWADRLAARLADGNPDFAYRNLAFEGATSADVLGQLGRPCSSSPTWSRSSAAPTTCSSRCARTPTPTAVGSPGSSHPRTPPGTCFAG